jgi:hypothetical protein
VALASLGRFARPVRIAKPEPRRKSNALLDPFPTVLAWYHLLNALRALVAGPAMAAEPLRVLSAMPATFARLDHRTLPQLALIQTAILHLNMMFVQQGTTALQELRSQSNALTATLRRRMVQQAARNALLDINARIV